MKKAEMIKELTNKVAEVTEARNKVFDFVDSIEEAVQVGAEAVAEIETKVQAKEEALTTFTELENIKKAKAEIDNLKADVELLKQVNNNKAVLLKNELGDKAEEFFKVHKSAVFLYRSVDDYLVVNTALSELSESKETMAKLGYSLEIAFAGVRQLLLDEGIVAQSEQNKRFRDKYHLGQRPVDTRLSQFESRVRTYIYDLRQAGVEI